MRITKNTAVHSRQAVFFVWFFARCARAARGKPRYLRLFRYRRRHTCRADSFSRAILCRQAAAVLQYKGSRLFKAARVRSQGRSAQLNAARLVGASFFRVRPPAAGVPRSVLARPSRRSGFCVGSFGLPLCGLLCGRLRLLVGCLPCGKPNFN